MNQQLAVLLADVFAMRVSDIHPDLKKDDVGSWDSLKQMDLVMSLERTYGIALDIPDILQMVSVAAVIAVLIAKGVDLGD
ncbi:acyl carrier protein [uncultured Thiodictyon sp.]|jgi:acyl carrier protein|uniref:acyl carrier protein n=1 Tax=uncultured Thiodictyon sp. TaxID=1846217 RepID=UPI0025FC29B9|nr:acyl carrier protein [uncultured Thiodictyon sp.]